MSSSKQARYVVFPFGSSNSAPFTCAFLTPGIAPLLFSVGVPFYRSETDLARGMEENDLLNEHGIEGVCGHCRHAPSLQTANNKRRRSPFVACSSFGCEDELESTTYL